jgi:hypothetical protein
VQGHVNNCDTTANIYSRDAAPGAAGSALQKPDIESAASALYSSADWTNPTCLPSTTPSPFDDAAHPGPNQSNPLTLFTGSSFDCKVVDNDGVTHRLAWNSTTKTISVKNGVYIDGDVSFPNGATTYSIGDFSNDTIGSAEKSNGTVYVNGIMNGSSNVNVCGPGTTTAVPNYGCPLRWIPDDGQLGFAVINPLNAATGFSMTGNGELDITIIVNQGYVDTGGTIIAGPVLADRATIGGNGGFVVPNNPPSGTPTDITTQASWVVQPGAWKEQK